jgi:hypothetical protein
MREIHPELCFYELCRGKPMAHGKARAQEETSGGRPKSERFPT